MDLHSLDLVDRFPLAVFHAGHSLPHNLTALTHALLISLLGTVVTDNDRTAIENVVFLEVMIPPDIFLLLLPCEEPSFGLH